jgi:uncharacterized membrane protein YphA (DoxX/SURF4 family)
MAQYLSAILFLAYGLNCFVSDKMIAEFERYRLPSLRVLTGVLQILGGAGLLVGHWSWPVLLLSSGGLALMMFLAVLTRYKIRDSIVEALPATSLCLLNAYVLIEALRLR